MADDVTNLSKWVGVQITRSLRKNFRVLQYCSKMKVIQHSNFFIRIKWYDIVDKLSITKQHSFLCTVCLAIHRLLPVLLMIGRVYSMLSHEIRDFL